MTRKKKPEPVARPSWPAPAAEASDQLLELDPDEPVFVLRATDLLAPETLQRWIVLARQMGVSSARVLAAERCVREMNDWRLRRGWSKDK